MKLEKRVAHLEKFMGEFRKNRHKFLGISRLWWIYYNSQVRNRKNQQKYMTKIQHLERGLRYARKNVARVSQVLRRIKDGRILVTLNRDQHTKLFQWLARDCRLKNKSLQRNLG